MYILIQIALLLIACFSCLFAGQPHPKYRAIIFDLGGVLVWDQKAVIRHALKNAEELFPDLINVMSPSEWTDFEEGRVGVEPIVSRLGVQKFRLSIEQHPKFLMPLEEGMELFKLIKEKGYKIYILSNIIDEHFKKISQKSAFMIEVDGMVLSYLVNAEKPYAAIYQKLLETYSLKPEECLFIDDLVDNVQGAKALGIDGIVCTDHTSVIQELKQLGVLTK
jgi:epoxide hydrolase-like predicted phosphatase